MSTSYHNTNEESGNTLDKSEELCKSQEELILRFIHDRKERDHTAHEIHSIFNKWPVTSIRRAMTNLMNKGELIKTANQRKGQYGKLTFAYKYKQLTVTQGNLFEL